MRIPKEVQQKVCEVLDEELSDQLNSEDYEFILLIFSPEGDRGMTRVSYSATIHDKDLIKSLLNQSMQVLSEGQN